MKKSIIQFIASIPLVLGAGSAFAQDNSSTAENHESHHLISPGGLFLEPILQGSTMDSNIKTSQLGLVGDTSGKTEGWGLGLKLGVHVSEVFFLGADGRYEKLHTHDSSYGDAQGDAYNYGPTAGVQMPILGLRLLGTYVLGGQYDPESGAQGVDVKFRDPRGWRVGAGIHVLAVSLNLEYQDLTYDNTDIQSFGGLPVSSATGVDYENKGYALSLSFPLEL